MSGYFLWLNENRPKLKEEFPDLPITELSKKAGEAWKKLEDKSVSPTSMNLFPNGHFQPLKVMGHGSETEL